MQPPRPARRLIDHLRQAAWLDHDRVLAWGCVLLVETAAFLLFLALWSRGVVMRLDHPTSSDFVSFYAAGKLTLACTPAFAYDHAAHLLAEGQRPSLAPHTGISSILRSIRCCARASRCCPTTLPTRYSKRWRCSPWRCAPCCSSGASAGWPR